MGSGFPSRTMKNLQSFLHQMYDLGLPGYAFMGRNADQTWWIDPTNGSDNHDGKTKDTAFATLTHALTLVAAGDLIYMLPGTYDESPIITVGLSSLTLVGLGNRRDAAIAPSTTDAVALEVRAPDVTLINIDVAANSTNAAYACKVYGNNFAAIGCMFEGGASQLIIQVPTIAQRTSGTYKGSAARGYYYDCEFGWGTAGVELVCSDFGAVTETWFEHCLFHDLTASSFTETVGSGGSAAVMFGNLWIKGCTFSTAEDGTVPTKWISLDGNNANAGYVANCSFPTAINSGKNLVSTALIWVGNYHTGGISTAQPS